MKNARKLIRSAEFKHRSRARRRLDFVIFSILSCLSFGLLFWLMPVGLKPNPASIWHWLDEHTTAVGVLTGIFWFVVITGPAFTIVFNIMASKEDGSMEEIMLSGITKSDIIFAKARAELRLWRQLFFVGAAVAAFQLVYVRLVVLFGLFGGIELCTVRQVIKLDEGCLNVALHLLPAFIWQSLGALLAALIALKLRSYFLTLVLTLVSFVALAAGGFVLAIMAVQSLKTDTDYFSDILWKEYNREVVALVIALMFCSLLAFVFNLLIRRLGRRDLAP